MSESPVITLDVRLGDVPGWQDATSSNNQAYSYLYAGGDGGKGDIEATVGKGQVVWVVRLVAEPRYRLGGCEFKDAPEGQLEWRGNSPRAGTITDKNTEVLQAKYTIVVTDAENGNCTIPCDPMITNRPPLHD